MAGNAVESGRTVTSKVTAILMAFAGGTGWVIKPEGACKADVCVPLGRNAGFDLMATADRLGMALVHDVDAGLWAVGPESFGGRALVSAQGPELVLDDLDEALDRSDVVLLLVHHAAFVDLDPGRLEGKQVVDTRGIWRGSRTG